MSAKYHNFSWDKVWLVIKNIKLYKTNCNWKESKIDKIVRGRKTQEGHVRSADDKKNPWLYHTSAAHTPYAKRCIIFLRGMYNIRT